MLENYPILKKYELDQRELLILQQELEKRRKNPVAVWILWAFLGNFGAHRFYLGKVGTGVIMLLVGWMTLGIWWIVDAFLITGMLRDNMQAIEAEILQELAVMRMQQQGVKSPTVQPDYRYQQPRTTEEPTRMGEPQTSTIGSKLVSSKVGEIHIPSSGKLISRDDFKGLSSEDRKQISRKHCYIRYENGRSDVSQLS